MSVPPQGGRRSKAEVTVRVPITAPAAASATPFTECLSARRLPVAYFSTGAGPRSRPSTTLRHPRDVGVTAGSLQGPCSRLRTLQLTHARPRTAGCC